MIIYSVIKINTVVDEKHWKGKPFSEIQKEMMVDAKNINEPGIELVGVYEQNPALQADRGEADIEKLSAAVHRAYCANYQKRKGEPYWTKGDYNLLDETAKEIDRETTRAVLAELNQLTGGRG